MLKKGAEEVNQYSFDLKPALIIHIDSAKEYYLSEYNSIHGGARKKHLSKIKYFDALKMSYEGWGFEAIAAHFKVSYSTIREQIYNIQNKVELYLKLKELGRL